MASSLRDPKGYYACLEVPPTASSLAIKSAYRRLAKKRHPDHNQSPSAQADFQRLNEAYQVLSSDTRRKVYDTTAWIQRRAQRGMGPAQGGKKRSTQSTRSGAVNVGVDRQTTPPHENAASATRTQTEAASSAPRWSSHPGTERGFAAQKSPFDPPHHCQCCGKIAAQPRYVVFPTVRGFLFKTRRGSIEGVFCRTCANTTALRVAWRLWLFGWWSRPLFTVKALFIIAQGGLLPRERNFHLLLHQARAFFMRHDRAIAHGLAKQAYAYATTPQERALAEGLLKAAPAVAGRALKDRWRRPSLTWMGHLVPPVLAALLVFTGVHHFTATTGEEQEAERPIAALPDLHSPSALTSVLGKELDRPMLLRTGRLYEVATRNLPLRTGPEARYRILRKLHMGTPVLVTENAPEGGWVKVLTAEGVGGFVAGRYLTPGLNERETLSPGVPGDINDDHNKPQLIRPSGRAQRRHNGQNASWMSQELPGTQRPDPF